MPSIDVNGLSFFYEDSGTGAPLLFLHGFTGQTASWVPIKKLITTPFRMIAIDLIGHGRTNAPPHPSRYAFTQAIAELATIATNLNLPPATCVGYSMGGRLALALALRHPDLVSALILESASPGIANPQERAARKESDDLLADQILTAGVAEFVARWEALPMWASQQQIPPERLAHQRQIRLHNQAAGLAGSLRGMGVGAQDSLWDELPRLRAPTLLIAGERDAKFAAIATRMAEQIPNAELRLAPNAGHAVHLEQPEWYAAQVAEFAAKHAPITERTSEED